MAMLQLAVANGPNVFQMLLVISDVNIAVHGQAYVKFTQTSVMSLILFSLN